MIGAPKSFLRRISRAPPRGVVVLVVAWCTPHVISFVQCPLGGERTACPVGFWTNGDTVSTSCVSCPPGTYYPTDVAGNATCTLCPPGTFSEVSCRHVAERKQPRENGRSCTVYTQREIDGGLWSLCTKRDEPLTKNEHVLYVFARALAFVLPLLGLQEYGQTECTPCPVGTFGRDSGADTCEVCPQGTYQDQVSQGAAIEPRTTGQQETVASGTAMPDTHLAGACFRVTAIFQLL